MNRFPAPGWTDHRLLPIALVLVVGLLYANSLPGEFILDDLYIVRDNPLLRDPDLSLIFRVDYWYGRANSGLFRPLTILSFLLNRLVFGPAPFGFHLVNVILHALVTVLLYRVLRLWGVNGVASGIGAFLFAAHPIHVEVVDVVVGRSELLVALFLLTAFGFACRRGFAAAVLVCFFFLLALLSKEHAVTFLVLLPLADAFRSRSSRIWKERWPLYVVLLAVALLWRLWVHYGLAQTMPRFPLAEAVAPLAFVDVTTRVLTALLLQWIYFFKLIFPVGLQAIYSMSDLPAFIPSLFSFRGLLSLSGSGLIILLLFIGWRRHNILAFFGILYLVAFLPTANIVFPIGVTMAERLTYFPSLWLCSGLGVLAAVLIDRPRLRLWSYGMLLVYGACLCWITIARNNDYSNELRLWSAEVVKNSKDFLGWENLADSLFLAGDIEAADTAYRWMLCFKPDYPGGLRGRALFFFNQGRYAEALQPALQAFALSQTMHDTVGMAFDALHLAEIYFRLGACKDALAYLDGPAKMLKDQLRYVQIRSELLSCL